MARGGMRPNAGRRRKDPTLKATAAERTAIAAAAPAAPAMIPPIHLSDLAQLLFADVVNLLAQAGRANPDFVHCVALLAQRLEQIQRWQAVLEMEGDTYMIKSGAIRARPEVAMLSDAMRQTQSLIGELMLNPSAALRLADGHKKAADDFNDF